MLTLKDIEDFMDPGEQSIFLELLKLKIKEDIQKQYEFLLHQQSSPEKSDK